MNINILSGQALSNQLMGLVTDPIQTDIYIKREELSITDGEIYDNFFAEFGNHSGLNISNCSIAMDCNRVTTEVVLNDMVELDYSLLSEDSKQIVDEFLILFQTA